MFLENLFIPIGSALQLTSATLASEHVTVVLVATASAVPCPRCLLSATRIHSRYQRTLADLPVVHLPVYLLLHVRRFFCDNATCPQRTFSERLPDLAAVKARRTARLRTEQRHLGLETSAEAAARQARRRGMPVSPSTLLRLARSHPPPSAPTPRVLGVDDFSLRKGQVFGTILVDLERHKPIDLLPDRSSDTLANWLEQHPGVEIISRDRSTEYADGATRGAPAAIQVADRFHLLQNLREALQRLLEQHLSELQAAQTPLAEPSPLTVSEPSDPSLQPADEKIITTSVNEQPDAVSRTRHERVQVERRSRRYERYIKVRELHALGHSIHEITRQMQISRQTVRRFVRAEQFPEQGQQRPRRRKLDPFIIYLSDQLAKGNDNGAALWRTLRDEQGYSGSRSQVPQWVAHHRHLCPSRPITVRVGKGRPPATQLPVPPGPRRRSARQVSWLLVRPFDDLEVEEQQLLERLTHACSEIEKGYTLGQSFITMVRTRDHAAFDQWLRDVHTSGVSDLERFATGLERDGAAVRSALSLPHSNGQVEGQVNRLKLIKRIAYGRARFELLRQRVLAA